MDEANLEALFRSHVPIVLLESAEELRARSLIQRSAGRADRSLYSWSATEGLKVLTRGTGPALNLAGLQLESPERPVRDPALEPEGVLATVKQSLRNAVIILLDFHPYLQEPKILRLLKEIAQAYYSSQDTLILLSHHLEVPVELKRYCARLTLCLPDTGRLENLIDEEVEVCRLRQQGGPVTVNAKARELLARNLLGLTESDARRLIRNAIVHDRAITHSDVDEVMQAKYELVAAGGVLSFELDPGDLSQVGGFEHLKEWLRVRRAPFLSGGRADDPDLPKGMLLIGVQGCGKSLAAKAVAGSWGVPLLRMDFGALYEKYIGETEKNVRRALRAAEVMAPCVLWIDEIEKAVARDDADGGTSDRVLGALLTWMAERRVRVFLALTANDISRLPPELIRKGRIDEIFFADLPEVPVREDILAMHLRKRGCDPGHFELSRLAAATEGFSGAELEQAIVAGRYAADADGGELDSERILDAIAQTRPLSRVMAEPIAALREWARDRAVPV